MTRAKLHVGVGGPVGSGKTALIEAIVPRFIDAGDDVLIVTNDIVTTEDAEHVRRTLEATGGHKARAAEILGVSRPRLNRLLEKYGIE